MRFKTLEIQGFKSFPDKTVLTFDSRTTAVVGSNGNGKSNISDALRWVMGEQGAKTLRGDKMEDVIFHGTQARKAMGFAKVTLTIDNSDGLLLVASEKASSNTDENTDENKTGLEPAPEVVITRSLYRTGESEYLINGRRSRLKDVHTLFMGTGLGRDGYSIIGQGRIDEIVNSKPLGRREIFEEAAGVSKFLFKKAAAERELERTQSNLERLLDIEGELKERLPRLEKQAEKANKAFALKERERVLGVAVGVRELDEIAKESQELMNAILLNQGECEHFDREISELEGEERAIVDEKCELNANIDTLRRKSESAKDDIAETDKEVAVKLSDIAHNTERIGEIREQITLSAQGGEELAEQIAELNTRIEGVRGEITAIEKEGAAKSEQLEQLSEQNASLDDAQGKLSSEIAQLYTCKTSAEIYINRAEENIRELEQQRETAANLAANQEGEKARLAANKDALKSSLGKLTEEKEETRNKLTGYSRLFESKAAKEAQAREELEELKSEQQRCKTRLDVLTDVENAMEGYYGGVKAVMTAAKSGKFGKAGILGTVADVIKVKKQHGTGIEVALGSALQHVIVSDENIAKRCIAFLKEARAGRATFLPLTTITGRVLEGVDLDDEDGFVGMGHEIIGYEPQYAEIIASLLGRTAFAEDLDSAAAIAKKHKYKFKIVTLDGQVINAGGSFTGGSVKKSEGIIGRKQELEDLRKGAAELAMKFEPAKAAHERLAAECAKMKLECEGMRESLAAFAGEELRLTAELGGAAEMLAQFEDRAEQSAEMLKQCEEKLESERSEIQRNNAELTRTLAQIEEKESAASAQGEELKAITENRRELAELIGDLNMQALAKNKDIENFEAQIAHLNKTRDEAGKNREMQLSEIAAFEDKSKALEREIEACREQITQIERDLLTAKERLGEYVSEIEAKDKRITRIQVDIREKIEHKQKFSNKLASVIERKSGLGAKAEEIKAMLFDEYELTYSEAVELQQQNQPQEEAVQTVKEMRGKLTELRRKLADLGDVNYASVTEFAEVKARYDDLSAQLTDIRRAKRELEKLIDELIVDIQTRFLAAFNEINGHFTRIFAEFFGGGEARLELVNAPNTEGDTPHDDVLGAGVEIFAAPPGKVCKNLIALSGGEKAMVAITLYFAILLYRPTPFCMLDEVDAALDERNVVKYINYLSRYSDTTQLMMITHRRPTIEGCDVLYGVFMQEKGVSRLLKQEIRSI